MPSRGGSGPDPSLCVCSVSTPHPSGSPSRQPGPFQVAWLRHVGASAPANARSPARSRPRAGSAALEGLPGTHLAACRPKQAQGLRLGLPPTPSHPRSSQPSQLDRPAPTLLGTSDPPISHPSLLAPPSFPRHHGALAIFEGAGLDPHGIGRRGPALREGLGSEGLPILLSTPGGQGHILTDLKAQARQLLLVGQRDPPGDPVRRHLQGSEGTVGGRPARIRGGAGPRRGSLALGRPRLRR